MALGMSGKIRKGMATKEGMPIFSRKASGIVYKDASKVKSPMPTKHPISGLSRQSSK